jgi:hypothetical protein
MMKWSREVNNGIKIFEKCGEDKLANFIEQKTEEI